MLQGFLETVDGLVVGAGHDALCYEEPQEHGGRLQHDRQRTEPSSSQSVAHRPQDDTDGLDRYGDEQHPPGTQNKRAITAEMRPAGTWPPSLL